MEKMGQAAMEFLLTYGWALIIIVIAIASLFFLGVFSTSSTTACKLDGPISCEGAQVLDNAVLIKLRSNLEGNSEVSDIKINGESCPNIEGKQLKSNAVNTVHCTGLNLEEDEQVIVGIETSYQKPGGIREKYEGEATGKASLGSYLYDFQPGLVAAYDFEDGLPANNIVGDHPFEEFSNFYYKPARLVDEKYGKAVFMEPLTSLRTEPTSDFALNNEFTWELRVKIDDDFERDVRRWPEFLLNHESSDIGLAISMKVDDNTAPSDTLFANFGNPTRANADGNTCVGGSDTEGKGVWEQVYTDPIIDGEWHHVAFTYDGSTMILYADGVNKKELAHTGGLCDLGPVSMMLNNRYKPTDKSNPDRWIDDVAIWNKALSPEVIADHAAR